MSDLLLAVDGSSSMTQAVLASREGAIVGRGFGPSSNHHQIGWDSAFSALKTAIEGAYRQRFGVYDTKRDGVVVAACLGLSGVTGPEDEEMYSSWLKEYNTTDRFKVVNDAEGILLGGSPQGWGVVIHSGVGSVCLGRSQKGRVARVGGWGSVLGDEGSGFWIAEQALHAATKTADGRAAAHGLSRAVLAHWGLARPQDLLEAIHRTENTVEDVAGLAGRVLDLARRGDEDAVLIVKKAGDDLAAHVDTVVEKLALSKPPLILAGGFLRGELKNSFLGSLQVEVGDVSTVSDPASALISIASGLAEGRAWGAYPTRRPHADATL